MASLIPILSIVFLIFATFYHLGEAKTFTVGGSDSGWRIPESNNTLNHWAVFHRFRVGDILEFKYDNKNDSVLEVTEENYNKCITAKPLHQYKEAPAMVTLNVSGPHYFISGASGHCNKDEKMIIVVQSPYHPVPPKPVPSAAPPTPSSKSPTSPTAPAPAPNTAVGLVARSGIFWAIVGIIGLAWA